MFDGQERQMPLKYNGAQREEYLNMIGRVGGHWMNVFEGRPEFYSAIYWDLFTGMWLNKAPVKKTDVLSFMKAVKSPHTAAKYVDTAVRRGILIESDNPDDARSKLLALAPDMKERLDSFLDAAVSEVRTTSREFDVKGPSPEDP